MEKNVTVVDEIGNEIGATYPKRAKGLVKKGRARYVDENTICLACPADIHSEEMMEENITLKDSLDKMDAVTAVAATMSYALQDFAGTLENKSIDDEDLAEKLSEIYVGVASAFTQREFTNRELIKFYTMVYQDLKSKEDQ